LGYKRGKAGAPIKKVKINLCSDTKPKCYENEVQIPLKIKNERFLSYFKQTIIETKFAAQILDFYPKSENSIVPEFYKSIPEFCFPTGACFTNDNSKITPKFFSFVLTNEHGNHIYGACLQFYEKVRDNELSVLNSRYFAHYPELFVPKSLVLMSQYSFIAQYKEILKQIYRLSLSQSNIPIEVFFLKVH